MRTFFLKWGNFGKLRILSVSYTFRPVWRLESISVRFEALDKDGLLVCVCVCVCFCMCVISCGLDETMIYSTLCDLVSD